MQENQHTAQAEAFRANDALRLEYSGLLGNETIQRALLTAKDSVPSGDVAADAEPIVSARVLSRRSGWSDCLDFLVSLAQPLPERPVDLGPATFADENREE